MAAVTPPPRTRTARVASTRKVAVAQSVPSTAPAPSHAPKTYGSIFISPMFNGEDKGDGGIRRVVEAQRKWLPTFGWEIADSPSRADIIAVHAGEVLRGPNAPRGDQIVVSHNHGLYWSGYQWSDPEWAANRLVVESLRTADGVTAPSEWVAEILRRGMWLNPTVLLHGIEPEDWENVAASDEWPRNYVLWNKTRTDPVCDPRPMFELARRAPDVPFVTTLGIRPTDMLLSMDQASEVGLPSNVAQTGKLPYLQAKQVVARAGVYLCTTRETMGIGTLEAMAAGCPVLGWAWGGQTEIVEHGVTGWLSRPGDFEDLLVGLRHCLANREQMGIAARDYVLQNHTWGPSPSGRGLPGQLFAGQGIMAGYHDFYVSLLSSSGRLSEPGASPGPGSSALGRPDRTAAASGAGRALRISTNPRVTVVVTCYKLERFLAGCLKSVMAQTAFQEGDVELIVVDDASPGDGSPAAQTGAQTIVASLCGNTEFSRSSGEFKDRVRFVRNETNLYLTGSLNKAISLARGRYIFALDADNMMGQPDALAIMANVLDNHREVDIVYGALRFQDIEGPIGAEKVVRDYTSSWPPVEFDVDRALKGFNQIPSSSLYRKKIWERVGGYRERMRTQDDADFWLRAVLHGARPARVGDFHMVTYRSRKDSMSAVESRTPYWSWYPHAKMPNTMPWGAWSGTSPIGPPSRNGDRAAARSAELSRLVHTNEPVRVAVIMPVGPGHERYIVDALDSLAAQTFREWAVVVVNDTGKELHSGWNRRQGGVPRTRREDGVDGDGSDGPALDDPGGDGPAPYWVHPYVHTVDSGFREGRSGAKAKGPATARNLGLSYATEKWGPDSIGSGTLQAVVFLDADDYVQPTFLEHCWSALNGEGVEGGARAEREVSPTNEKGEDTRGVVSIYKPGFVYTDWIIAETGEVRETPDWSDSTAFYTETFPHPITCMIALTALQEPRSQDEGLKDERTSATIEGDGGDVTSLAGPGLADGEKATASGNGVSGPKTPKITGFDSGSWVTEDRDFYMRLRARGVCGLRIPLPLLYYRTQLGQVRKIRLANRDEVYSKFYARWGKYIDGAGGAKEEFVGCGCGGGRVSGPPQISQALRQAMAEQQLEAGVKSGDAVILRFIREGRGTTMYRGSVTGTEYLFGSGPGFNRQLVHKADAEFFLQLKSDFALEQDGALSGSGAPHPASVDGLEPLMAVGRPR